MLEILGLVKLVPVPNTIPPVAAAYQLIVPALVVAPKVTVPMPHRVAGVVPVSVGNAFTVAVSVGTTLVAAPLEVQEIFPEAPSTALLFNRTYVVVVATVPDIGDKFMVLANAPPDTVAISYPVGAKTVMLPTKVVPDTVKLSSEDSDPLQELKGVKVPDVVMVGIIKETVSVLEQETPFKVKYNVAVSTLVLLVKIAV